MYATQTLSSPHNHNTMYGGGQQPNNFHHPPPPGAGGPPSLPPPHQDPNLLFQNPNLFLQNPNFPQFIQNPNFQFLQNPNFHLQNPNFAYQQNPNLLLPPNFPNYFPPHQLPPTHNPNLSTQQPQKPSKDVEKKIKNKIEFQQHHSTTSHSLKTVNNNKSLEKIERAVAKARRKIVGAEESVTAWNVSSAALAKLKVDSWTSLGIQMQEVPSLLQLMTIEGKINAFINCFVGVRRITSLYDLEVAICKSEGIKQFEELELGPLIRHPLVIHYFSVDSDVNEVYKISSDEIITHLWEYMNIVKKKEIRADTFLDFVARERSVMGRDGLGVRIQSLGMHVNMLLEAKRLEDASLIKRLEEKLKQKSNNKNKSKKRPLFFTQQKKVLDERFSALSQRIKSFSSVKDDFDGKHTKFMSSSSEDNDCGDDKYKTEDDEEDSVSNHGKSSSKSCDRMSSCPYPSATEEMTRLGLKGEMEVHPSPASYTTRYDETSGPSRKKRRSESAFTKSAPTKLAIPADDEDDNNELQASKEDDFSLANSDMGLFISTWKKACCDQTVPEVFDRMLQFYNLSPRQKKRMKSVFMMYPCIGLLNAAVTSIKLGKCDSMYDTLQDGLSDMVSDTCPQYESIEVEPSAKNECISDLRHGLTVEDITEKITAYFELENEALSTEKSHFDKLFILSKKLSSCEVWLTEQFSVKEFKALGHGEFVIFLQKYSARLPIILSNMLVDDIHEKSLFKVCIVESQLLLFLAQALNSSWEDVAMTQEKISVLLTRQFPLINFNILEKGSAEDFFNIVKDGRSCASSNCILYSLTLAGTLCDYGDSLLTQNSVTSNDDAIKALLRAPMLSDLNLWSHWDLIYYPLLGPLVGWLANVNNKELLCLVTKDGKVVRINPSATLDSYFQASLQASPFGTAVELLSLFSLLGGKRHVPLSLLKCHTRQAFKVILQNSVENRAVPVASKFILDCLCYLPSEFRCFATDLLLSGLRSFIKDAPSAILGECHNQIEQRVMLHEIGLSLGIVEWIDDYNKLCSAFTDIMNPSEIPLLKAQNLPFSSTLHHDASDKLPSSKAEVRAATKADSCTDDCAEVSSNQTGSGCWQNVSEPHKDAALVIESIRREEFGLDSNVSETESNMLKKQHSRLGRALHCLSQELYSQDSHFLLELVQNADDNIYLESVEPTLTFILRDTGIVVLNNERGFSPNNIRALCDVGNSTKKGSGAGYIGQKGIGFKSVFRVTDAPEIHSNGFHVKFDISEGQIGFVLPTQISPCNIDLFRSLADESSNASLWNTCIVLPFRAKSLEMKNSIMSMFSDLHPSLLLFLHRLRCIKYRNLINNSLVIMRKDHIGNGIIKVSHGCEKMTWLVVSQKLQADAILRPDVQTTEIALAFTLGESENNGDYVPCLELQPVFAFLPLRAYGLKFILQGDFVLPSSREEVDGDSPWNQWLLSECPALFVNAERSFCALPCFRGENVGKAVSAYMNFVPLVGEVHGFFSSLPRMIISKLRMSNCLLLEGGDKNTWVPPCKAIRKWNEQTRILLPESLLHDHLGLGFLDQHIVLSDALARALGVEEYGPKILLQAVSSLCRTENGIKSMGMGWLCSWLNELYNMSFHSSINTTEVVDSSEVIDNLRKIPFIPLSDGTYVSVNDEGTIWLQQLDDALLSTGGFDAFPMLYANLRTVNPSLLASAADMGLVDSITRILHTIGVERLFAHEILKVHVLPSLSDDALMNKDKSLMTEYLAYAMHHLQSGGCFGCRDEREFIVSELGKKAYILTNYGYKRPVEVPIHFGIQYENPVKAVANLLIIDSIVDDFKWHEVDVAYLSHPVSNSSLTSGSALTKWREFLHELGVTDFISVVPLEKSIITGGIPQSVVAKDWESDELVKLLSTLSLNKGNREKSTYMLEALDSLWDHEYSYKALGYYCNSQSGERDCKSSFRSSFMSSICDVQWVSSSIDDMLHYSKDLFHDCDAVRSLLGACAPYAIPKVKSEKLLGEIGFKTEVTLDDILSMLQVWRRTATPFEASIAQMSRVYTFIWNEINNSRNKIMKELGCGPCIFIPYATTSLRHGDDVLHKGIFMSPEDVYWHDSTGSIEQVKMISARFKSTTDNGALNKILSDVYPSGLHDFFVNECGAHETPPLLSYLQILLQLSTIALPSQTATTVFQVFLKWGEGLKSGLLSSEDVVYLREGLLKVETSVIPTIQDKWVSLHTSFGLVCWCNDEDLKEEFKHSDNIDFIQFGELSNDEMELLQAKVSLLLKSLGIPSISEVVTREAIYSGLINNCTLQASLVKWAMPYAQRYIYNKHPAIYSHLKDSGFQNLHHFRVSVVESLSYRNVIKRCNIASKKKVKCKSLLQGNILFATVESDSHSIFMELSCLFFDGTPELNMANFLHMITTMVESGFKEEQLELFILNSQKLPKIPREDEDSVWSLSTEDDSETVIASSNDQNSVKSSSIGKRDIISSSNWPPADWKTAPDFSYARANGLRTQAAAAAADLQHRPCSKEEHLEDPIGIDDAALLDTYEDQSDDYPYKKKQTAYSNMVYDPNTDIKGGGVSDDSKFSWRERINTGNPDLKLAMETGRLGEVSASKHFIEKFGKNCVNWVNEHTETGSPYDIVIHEKGKITEYIEVKATRAARKDWFIISTREWNFAVEQGDSFSVAHVVLSDNNPPKVAIFKNPYRLCQSGQLQLLLMMPKQDREYSVISL